MGDVLETELQSVNLNVLCRNTCILHCLQDVVVPRFLRVVHEILDVLFSAAMLSEDMLFTARA